MRRDDDTDPMPELRPSGRVSCKITPAQQLAFDMHAGDPQNPMVLPRMRLLFEGALDRDVLARCLDDIVSRHAVLGSRFTDVGGSVHQLLPMARHSVHLDEVSFVGLPEESQQARWRELLDRVGRPFDLDSGPLARFVLVELDRDRHVLLMGAHHIAFDRGSVTGLVSDLARGYRALLSEDDWPEPELQYIDLAAYLDALEQSRFGKNQRAFWNTQLAAAKPLELPIDHSRSSLDARRDAHPRGIVPAAAAEVAAVVEHPVHGEMVALARAERASTYIVLLAAMTACLARVRRQDWLTYQTTYSLRGRPGTANMIGYVGNPILVCIEAAGVASYRELIGRTRRAVLDAWGNGEVPIANSVSHGLRRINFNYVPGVETSFDKQDFAPGLSITQLRTAIDIATVKIPWDLHLWLYEAPDRTNLRMLYLRELFEPATAQRLLGLFVEVLSDMCKDPDKPLR